VSPADDAPTPPGPSRRTILGIVFTTILIDFVGFSVLLPVLPSYARQFGASAIEIGLIVSLYAAAQLVFLPAWGWLSDRIGRRPVLLISLAGTSVSFLLLAVGGSLLSIYVARVLAGFFAGSIGTAQAVVTDVTDEADRAHGMGLIGAAFGIGFVLGPALGGALAHLDPSAPFYAIVVLSAANLAAAWLWLPESHPPPPGPKLWGGLGRTLVPSPVRVLFALHDRRIALFLFLFLVLFTGFAALEAMFMLFMKERFGVSDLAGGLMFAWIGVAVALTQGVLIRLLAPRLGEPKLVVYGLVAMGAGLSSIALVQSWEWLFLVSPLIAIGNGLALPAFTSLYSKACEASRAGELMGESQSMATTGRIIGPVWAGFALDRLSLEAPFLIAGGLMFAALALFALWRRPLLGSLD
jgi:multidrug resistance protein